MVKLGIGTFRATPSYNSYYLHMDTGSELLWIQCERCRAQKGRCFAQRDPLFANTRSQSYLVLLCNKFNYCIPNQCIESSSSYNISYADDTSSAGILAQGTLTFNSNTRQSETVQHFVFGCGIDNRATYDDNSNQIAGVWGLGWERHSFVSQTDSHSNGKFSFCLPVVNKYTRQWPTTYLRLGVDVAQHSNLHFTSLKCYQHWNSYLVELQGISLNKKRLNIKASVFGLRRNGTGGCIVDTETPFSPIVSSTYAILRKALKNYFSSMRNLKKYGGQRGLDLCYEREKAQGFKSLPSITFHLKNGDLVVGFQGSFLVMDKIGLAKGEYFCLAMTSYDGGTAIKAYQQMNQRLVYDTKGLKLFFGPEYCSRDA